MFLEEMIQKWTDLSITAASSLSLSPPPQG